MNLAVKLYRDAANPRNIPGDWPAEVIELGDKTELPDGPWMLMTIEQYTAYKAERQSAYTAWEAANPLPSSAAPDPLTVIADLQAQIDALKAQLGSP